jgi:hypothetical protein
MSFKQWLESRENNIYLVQQAIKDLSYMLDMEEDALTQSLKTMPMEQIAKHIEAFGLAGKSIDPRRFAAMMKMYAKGNI